MRTIVERFSLKRYLFGMVFLLSLGLIPAFAQEQPLSVAVDKMPDQPLPVTILSARLQNFQYTSQLDAVISIEKGTAPAFAEFYLVLYRDGKVIAGEGWRENSLDGTIFRDMKLALQPGDHALLIVTSVGTSSRTLQLNPKDLGDRIHELIEGRNPQPLPVDVSLKLGNMPKAIRCQSTCSFCDNAQKAATNACGEGQISSFSCNCGNGRYSYACKRNKPSQPGGGTN